MYKERKKEFCQKKLWNGVHREEENEVNLEEDWNDWSNWRKKII
jgi:hypothetical protein